MLVSVTLPVVFAIGLRAIVPHRPYPVAGGAMGSRRDRTTMTTVAETIEGLARHTGFSGVVRVDEAGEAGWSAAYSSADRAHEIANTPETIFALASRLRRAHHAHGGVADRGRDARP
jgi:CubicO group peptidase (beta-lactamase class C family)